jgi:hypothetical protein
MIEGTCGARDNAFCKRQDALSVQFIDCFGAVDLRERQLLAQLVAFPAEAGEVDRFGIQECFVEPVSSF